MKRPPLGIRWTIGDVHPLGFDALRLSLWGARKVFGPQAALAVCVNTIPHERAQELTGEVPPGVEWIESPAILPDFLRPWVDARMAEGVAWKFSPMRVFPDRHEIALDNDCILWSVPQAIRDWLSEETSRCLIAEDVRCALGKFQPMCGPEPRNSGIRGLPPRYDFASALEGCLKEAGVLLESELDEQGLQVAAVNRLAPAHVVRVDEVAICSPFPPHRPGLGTCGAHFVGLNAKNLPWTYEGKPASQLTRAHYLRWRSDLQRRVGLSRALPEPL